MNKLLTFLFFILTLHADILDDNYEHECNTLSDIQAYIPILRDLARECPSVIEIGTRHMNSTWGIFKGLSENPHHSYIPYESYLGIDINKPPYNRGKPIKAMAKKHNIYFQFWKKDDMTINLPLCDLLFIDSLHTYCHLSYELEKFCDSVCKYIALHDTSPPWGYQDDAEYCGNRSEYPDWINREKRGLWQAVIDFLEKHPEWELYKRYETFPGFTILKRTNVDDPNVGPVGKLG